MSWTVKGAAKTHLPKNGYEIKCKWCDRGFEDIVIADFPQLQAKLQAIIKANDPKLSKFSFDWIDGRRLEARRQADKNWYVYDFNKFISDEIAWTHNRTKAIAARLDFTTPRPTLDVYLVDSVLNILKK